MPPPNHNVTGMSGAVALPRRSGELVFHDPWERRVFSLTVALCERGLYDWDEFRERLIAEIAAAEESKCSDPPSYYQQWLTAFEKLLVAKGICAAVEIRG